MVGGDYYDYVRMADGRWGIVVADVSGHEIGASLLMAKTRAYLRALAKSDDDVQTILGRLHEFLLEDTQDKWFVTMFFAALDAPDRSHRIRRSRAAGVRAAPRRERHDSQEHVDAAGRFRRSSAPLRAPRGARERGRFRGA